MAPSSVRPDRNLERPGRTAERAIREEEVAVALRMALGGDTMLGRGVAAALDDVAPDELTEICGSPEHQGVCADVEEPFGQDDISIFTLRIRITTCFVAFRPPAPVKPVSHNRHGIPRMVSRSSRSSSLTMSTHSSSAKRTSKSALRSPHVTHGALKALCSTL
jgi:hypothetical protein